MEIATPDAEQILSFIKEFPLNSGSNISYILDAKRQKVLSMLNSYGFKVPHDKLRIKEQQLDNLVYRFRQKIDKRLDQLKNRLALSMAKLESADLNRILKKGFALISQNSKIVTRAAAFDVEDTARIKFYDNEIEVRKVK